MSWPVFDRLDLEILNNNIRIRSNCFRDLRESQLNWSNNLFLPSKSVEIIYFLKYILFWGFKQLQNKDTKCLYLESIHGICVWQFGIHSELPGDYGKLWLLYFNVPLSFNSREKLLNSIAILWDKILILFRRFSLQFEDNVTLK